MNGVAHSLSDADIDVLAQHWSSLSADDAPGKAVLDVVSAHEVFPQNYPDDFTVYDSVVSKDGKTLTRRLANSLAIDAIVSGSRMPAGAVLMQAFHQLRQNPDGSPAAGDINGYSTMTQLTSAASDIPDLLRNGAWSYGLFAADRTPRPGINQAPCLACHASRQDSDYIFTVDALRSHAKARQGVISPLSRGYSFPLAGT